jgi:homoserine kinase
MFSQVRVFAPATVTNVGCGFDILGFALDWPGDEVILRLKKEPGITISNIHNDEGKLPLEAQKNTAGRSLSVFAQHLGLKEGIEIEIHKKMALGTGLGSSAASAVAAVFALNELLEKPLDKKSLLPFALVGEKISCGENAPADNVAACLLGGFIVVRSTAPLDVFSIDYPENLHCTIIHPHIELKTADMRKIIRNQIYLSDAVQQWGNIAGLIAGLIKKDLALIARSLQDVIIEPVRSKLIPGFYEVKQAAMDAGALGSSISGSGPSIFALSDSEKKAQTAGEAMEKVFAEMNIDTNLYISKINKNGPIVLDSSYR